MVSKVVRGRMMFVALITLFALPAVVAKFFLVNQWYESGVTNKGLLIEPKQSYENLGVNNPYTGQQWQLGYLVPAKCNEFCYRQIHLLGQSHVALGKYQSRVAPVLLLSKVSDHVSLDKNSFNRIKVNDAFHNLISDFELVIIDPLGQLVMRYPVVENERDLVSQSKDILTDLRKLLKLSRVG
ncbi:hypothetical protein [Vibrio sp.]|uniref:hypothetical protein n=1 Tax=Vibrio sp. TaxID=678 RepID=UPI00311E3825